MPTPKRRLFAAIFGLAVLFALFLPRLLPRPMPHYTVTDLGILPGATVSRASAINNWGEIIGLSGANRMEMDRRHAFLYQDGAMRDLGDFNLINDREGPAINDSSQIAGAMTVTPAPRLRIHACLNIGGQKRDLGTLPGCVFSVGNGINSQGQVVGEAMSLAHAGGMTDHAFFYSGGRTTDIGTPPGYTDMVLDGINTSGLAIGYCHRPTGVNWWGINQAVSYDTRTRRVTVLTVPPGSSGSLALAINGKNQIAGSEVQSGQLEQAVLWEAGRMTRLGTPSGTDSSRAEALNDQEAVVGSAHIEVGMLSQFVLSAASYVPPLVSLTQQPCTEHAFIYQGGEMQDLNMLLPADADWTLEQANGINDKGQIVGYGLHHGQERAFLLTPIR